MIRIICYSKACTELEIRGVSTGGGRWSRALPPSAEIKANIYLQSAKQWKQDI